MFCRTQLFLSTLLLPCYWPTYHVLNISAHKFDFKMRKSLHKFSMISSLLIPACVCHFLPYTLNYLLMACTCLEFLYISKLWYIFMANTKIWIGVPDWSCHRNLNKISTVIRADTLLRVLDWILQYQIRYSVNTKGAWWVGLGTQWNHKGASPKKCLMSWVRDPVKPQFIGQLEISYLKLATIPN